MYKSIQLNLLDMINTTDDIPFEKELYTLVSIPVNNKTIRKGLRKYKIILQVLQQQITPVPGAAGSRHNGFPII